MKRIAGYRSRDHDAIQFVEAPNDGSTHLTDLVLTIEPGQLVVVGDVDLATADVQRSPPGEWGRIGPAPSVSDSEPGSPAATSSTTE